MIYTTEEKAAIFATLSSLINVDNNVAPEELDALYLNAGEHIGMDNDADILSRQMSFQDVSSIISGMIPPKKLDLIMLARMIVEADGEVHINEAEFLVGLMDILGLKPSNR